MLDKILSTRLFSGIAPIEAQSLLFCLKYKIQTYQKNSIVINENAGNDNLYILLEGSAIITKESNYQEPHITGFLNTFDCFEIDTVFSQTAYPSTLTTTTKSKFLIINKHRATTPCINYCLRHMKFIKNLFSEISLTANHRYQHLQELRQKSLRQKILLFLFNYKNLGDFEYFEIPFNRNQLANYLGVDRSAMSNELSKLKSEKIIDFNKNSFRIISTKKLI